MNWTLSKYTLIIEWKQKFHTSDMMIGGDKTLHIFLQEKLNKTVFSPSRYFYKIILLSIWNVGFAIKKCTFNVSQDTSFQNFPVQIYHQLCSTSKHNWLLSHHELFNAKEFEFNFFESDIVASFPQVCTESYTQECQVSWARQSLRWAYLVFIN